MSRSKTLITMGNALAALETLFVGLIIFAIQVPDTYSTAYSEGDFADAYLVWLFIGIPFVLSIIGQIINWVGLGKIDGVNRQRWRLWFLVIGILTLCVNLISGILYIVAFSFSNREHGTRTVESADGEFNGTSVAQMPRINDWTLQSNLEDLRDWKVLSDSEVMSVRNELRI